MQKSTGEGSQYKNGTIIHGEENKLEFKTGFKWKFEKAQIN